jgi:polynucleotide 5'-hydroxyl-kinase GRC3/NOL9
VDGNTISQAWIEAAGALASLQKKPVIAMVVGKADSGKTGFCTHLINRLVNGKRKIAVLDGDLGQSDVGPPSTVAYTFVTKPVTDLFTLKAENAFFVGFTSPSEAVDKVVRGLGLMKLEILDRATDFIVVNTDGWIEGEEAVRYKLRLAEELNPDVVFCLQQNDELAPLLAALGKFRKSILDSPLAIRQRDREKRRDLRGRGYAKYLAEAKVKTWSLKLVKVEEQNGTQDVQSWQEDGLLGLYDSQRRFLGIGVLRKIDSARKTLKVFTSVSVKPATAALGKVRLDENLKEIEAKF